MTAGAALGSALFLFGGAAAANAEPADGRVDLAIGTAGVLTGLPIEAASQIAAGVCDSDTAEITTAAESVDASGTQQSVCNNALGAVDFRQNGTSVEDGASGVIDAPGTAEGTSFSEEPAPDDVTGDEEPATEGTVVPEAPTATTTAPGLTPGS